MRCIGYLLIAPTLALLAASSGAANDETEEKAVKLVIEKYTKAFETGDFELLSSIFAHEPDIVLINAGHSEWLVGWTNVAPIYKLLFSVNQDVTMQHTDISIKLLASNTAALLTCRQSMKGTYQGQAFEYADMRMTCVLEKQQGTWRIVHGHWSWPSTPNAKAGDE